MNDIEVLDVSVQWSDGYENAPSLKLLVDRRPSFEVYEKRPCYAEQLSSEQVAVVGSRARQHRPDWNLYWARDGDFAWFFTWGGKPDDGFGGRRRTVELTDGTEEEVVGGWHCSPGAATDVGLPATTDCSYVVAGDRLMRDPWPRSVGVAFFVLNERLEREIIRHLPDCEIVEFAHGLTVGWRGQPTKAEFMATEHARREQVINTLKARYGREWDKVTDDEREGLACRPYSALDPARVA